MLGLACRDHLDVMYGAEAPPLDWDRQQRYTRENIELYYLSHAASPLKKEDIVEVRQLQEKRRVVGDPAGRGRRQRWRVKQSRAGGSDGG